MASSYSEKRDWEKAICGHGSNLQITEYGLEVVNPLGCPLRSNVPCVSTSCGLMEKPKRKKKYQQCPDTREFPSNCPLWGGVKLIPMTTEWE